MNVTEAVFIDRDGEPVRRVPLAKPRERSRFPDYALYCAELPGVSPVPVEPARVRHGAAVSVRHFPWGQQRSSRGHVRWLPGGRFEAQIDSDGGSSGAGVLDRNGRLVGVLVGDRGLSEPISSLRKSGGPVIKAYLHCLETHSASRCGRHACQTAPRTRAAQRQSIQSDSKTSASSGNH